MAYFVNLILLLVEGAVLLLPVERATVWSRRNALQRKAIFCTCATAQWVAVSGLRALGVGADTQWYASHYLRAQTVPWSDIGYALLRFQKVDSSEAAYQALAKVCRFVFGGNYQMFFVVVAISFFVPLGIFLYRNSRYPVFSYVLFSCMLYETYAVAAARQAVATGVGALLAYECVKKRKPVCFVLLVLLGACFHKSCIFFLPLYFLARFPIRRWYTTAALLAFPVVFLLRGKLLTAAAALTGYDSYADQTTGYGRNFTMIYCILVCVAVWRSGIILKNRPEAAHYYHALYLGLAILPFVLISPSVMRIVYYFALFLLLLVPEIIQSFPRRSERMLAYGVSMVLVLALLIKNQPGYAFFWQG